MPCMSPEVQSLTSSLVISCQCAGQTADISDARLCLQSHKTERVHGHVLEPCKISVHVDMAKGTGDVRLQISDVHIRVSPDVLELAASLQASVLEPLIQPSADRCHTLVSVLMLILSSSPLSAKATFTTFAPLHLMSA